MKESKKLYFASDVHLGASALNNNRERELRFVAWLDKIKYDAFEIFLVGDIFDFWYEYKYVVPKGYVRVLGKLAEITDSGIPVHLFAGNHDVWYFDYLQEEVGLQVHHDPIEVERFRKKFFIGHGDGLGNFDPNYIRMKKLFRNRFAQWMFSRIHPNFAFGLANRWSKHSRLSHGESENRFLGEDREEQVRFARQKLSSSHVDYFVFGHRHLLLDYDLNENSKLIILGDWIHYFSFGEFDGERFDLKKLEKNKV